MSASSRSRAIIAPKGSKPRELKEFYSEETLMDGTTESKPKPALKLNFMSHGTLESKDLDYIRKFYEEFLGIEVVQTSPISLLIRLGGDNTIAVVKAKNKTPMSLLNHNGL